MGDLGRFNQNCQANKYPAIIEMAWITSLLGGWRLIEIFAKPNLNTPNLSY